MDMKAGVTQADGDGAATEAASSVKERSTKALNSLEKRVKLTKDVVLEDTDGVVLDGEVQAGADQVGVVPVTVDGAMAQDYMADGVDMAQAMVVHGAAMDQAFISQRLHKKM